MFLVLKRFACALGARRKASASIGENRYDVFRSRDFSLARTTLNHSRLACYPAYV